MINALIGGGLALVLFAVVAIGTGLALGEGPTMRRWWSLALHKASTPLTGGSHADWGVTAGQGLQVAPWTCCGVGAETAGAVHEGDCPYYAAAYRVSPRAALDLPDRQWRAHIARAELFGEPDGQTGRVIRWTPSPYDPRSDGGHLWAGTRGPYAFCARPRCRLVYPQWAGDLCPGRHWWAGRTRTSTAA